MNITIVSLDNWGFNEYLKKTLCDQGHQVVHINFNDFKYTYPGFLHRVGNFLSKLFLNTNFKHQYYGKEIIRILEKNPVRQDIILTLKADFIDKKSLKAFKKFTDKSIAFFNDNIKRYPNIKNVIDCFDEVYSFEKGDCKKHHLQFATNFIYNLNLTATKNAQKLDIFNISSGGKRNNFIKQIAKQLHTNEINYKFIIFDKNKKHQDELIEIIHEPISLEKVNELNNQAMALLDIHRKGQDGLTFRVFECLGLQKKLITTNKDISTYDFYNPNNILIIDMENPIIPKSFFETGYTPVSSEILHPYTIEGWLEKVLFKK